jgi:hypothetical protein
MEVRGQLHDPAALPQRKLSRYTLERRLSGPQIRPGRCGEEEITCPCRKSNPGHLARSPSLLGGIKAYLREQEFLERIIRPLSFHCILSIWYDTDHIPMASNTYSIVACVFVAAGTCLLSRFIAAAVSSGPTITVVLGKRHKKHRQRVDLISLVSLFFKMKKVSRKGCDGVK